MHEIIPYYKPLGLTPLQAIEKLKQEQPGFKDLPITYAGRLDPMAEGLLLLLTGKGVHRKQEFLDLPKTYQAKILFSFTTDTYDILGLAKSASYLTIDEEINAAVQNLAGTHTFPYPPYSSKTLQGKPLWQWARENKLGEIQIPTREMTVDGAELTSINSVPWTRIYNIITTSIQLVTGDFRQSEILTTWEQINTSTDPDQEFHIADIEFKVSSGTYIRSLANELGKNLGTGAILLSLNRTAIGDYTNSV